jgi:hypothetical protein
LDSLLSSRTLILSIIDEELSKIDFDGFIDVLKTESTDGFVAKSKRGFLRVFD